MSRGATMAGPAAAVVEPGARHRLPLMRSLLAILVLPACACAAAAQTAPAPGTPARGAVPPVVACASLANLRALLAGAKGDVAAALRVAGDPKSDLGCGPVDRAAVTGLVDHLALNGRAYDCLGFKGTRTCHWTEAGLITEAGPAPARQRPDAPPARGADRGRR